MPIIITPLPCNDSGPAVADLQRALLKFGAPIADAEKNAQRLGDSTLAAVLAFRNQHGLPPVAGNAAPFDAFRSVGCSISPRQQQMATAKRCAPLCVNPSRLRAMPHRKKTL